MKKLMITGLLAFIFVLPVMAEEGRFPGVSGDGISGDVLGMQRRNVHSAVALGFQYTDNLYNSKNNKEADTSFIFSPSIALALPGTRRVDVALSPDTAAPGGLGFSRERVDSTDRYLAYLVYNPKAEFYADNSDENFTSHNVKGAVQYNAPGGLTLDLAAKYAKASEARGEVGNRYLDEYEDMLYDFIVRYDFSPKLFVRGTASGYNLEYDRTESDFRNRTDMAWSMAAGYKFSPKTELSMEYQKVWVDYDKLLENPGTHFRRDSDEQRYALNLAWRMTAKSRGRFKIGQVEKSLDGGKDDTALFMELQLVHNITTRSQIMLEASRRFYETNFKEASYYISERINLAYRQEFTPRITGKVRLGWSADDYSGITLENDTYRFNPSCEYSFNNWLAIEGGYSYVKRTSDRNDLEYDTNTFTLTVIGRF
ncbi:outer membrane beta-barrel protein [Desulfobotulus sp. H1]|uniref:Outer membrane beta-barrel protein n=1 Tax=Desulfobotulus pelophilus TaxID=2823377 RepID=A0ABT3NDR5_9BACT|nr:outer membrane beta-barrel protein [Desulfobotulus pelophilus]MCW7755072.1 outer membrane beta-barrel protein [Desulfobotulus pelophilus]